MQTQSAQIERPNVDNQSRELRALEAEIRHLTGKAIAEYDMISTNDRIMVCLSGGKDSYVMLDMLLALKRRAPVPFELLAVNLDQKQPGFPEHVLPEYLANLGVDYHIIEQDTYSVVKRVVPEGKTMCAMCSRLRRGSLYTFAAANGINKIALGHHRDDIIETFFLNMFHARRLKAMPPKLLSEDRRHIVIRPLSLCAEAKIARYAELKRYPIIPCTLCGSQDHLQRVAIKRMLNEWDTAHPGRSDAIMRSLQRASPSHLADPALFDFAGLEGLRDARTPDATDANTKNNERS